MHVLTLSHLLLQVAADGDLIFGIPLPAVVLLIVELLKWAGVVKTGDQARLANVALSLLGGLALGYIANIGSEETRFLTVAFSSLYNVLVAAMIYKKVIEAPAEAKKLEDAQVRFAGEG